MTQFRDDFGMAFAAENRSMADKGWKYDSRKKKWTVDTKQKPSHLDVIELRGGSKWVMDKALVAYQEEVLFKIEHHMPFKPKVLVYFYTVDAATGWSQLIGTYTINHAYMLTNAVTTGEEGLFPFVDETYFYIKHFAETFGFGVGNNTFFGDDYKFRIRYEILNQETFWPGQKY